MNGPKHARWLFIGGALFVLIGGMIQPGTTGGPKVSILSEQSCMLITRAMSAYAQKHGGNYPNGSSSTEIFQKLLDDGEIADFAVGPSIFYARLAGKTPAPDGEALKPENVAFDVTVGANASSPDGLPVVYLTGFRLNFHAGGGAVSRIRPYPVWWGPVGFFGHWWWMFGDVVRNPVDWMTVGYKCGDVRIKESWDHGHQIFDQNGFGTIPNVIAPDFDAHGHIYRQLTPDGVLK